MSLTRFQKIALSIAGITAFAIGAFILFAPHAFYANYGIALGQDPNLLSELRAPGAGLTVLGAIMLSGLVRAEWAPVAFVAALTVYLAFPVGRVISLAVDGMPSGSVLGAFAIEVVIAGLCVAALVRRRAHETTRDPLAGQPS